MHAFIVESPGKVPHIQKYLDALYGPRVYVVAATSGHFCGLPKMDGQAFADVVDLASWSEHWTIHKTDIHVRLKRLIGDAERVFIATDADREGEAIAWHLMRVFHLDDRRAVRVRYTEVTKPALKAAIENPGVLDVKLVAAQRARQVLDYEFGMELSRPLWRFGCRSAGRVQSAAVRILVDRENTIRSFKAQGFSTIAAHYAGPIVATLHTSSPTPMVGELARQDPATEADETADAADADSDVPLDPQSGTESARARYRVLRLTEQAIATRLEQLAKGSRHRLADVEKATTTRRPPPPFITSTLLSTASQTLRLPAKKVTAIAQTLFEKGLITYLRTDCERQSVSDSF